MSSYVVSPQADEDIFEVWRYLYERASVEVANRVESEFYAAFEALAQNPRIGHKRSDLTSYPVLFFTVYSYMIVYRPHTPLENRAGAPWQAQPRAYFPKLAVTNHRVRSGA